MENKTQKLKHYQCDLPIYRGKTAILHAFAESKDEAYDLTTKTLLTTETDSQGNWIPSNDLLEKLDSIGKPCFKENEIKKKAWAHVHYEE